jgi:hypothetical protein
MNPLSKRRPYLPITVSSCAWRAVVVAATLLVGVVSCGGGDFMLLGDEAGAGSSSAGSGSSSSGRGSGSSSGASSSGTRGGGSGAGSSGSGASSGGSGSSGGGSSSGSVRDSGVCPPGQSWCAPCPGSPGRCAQVCPAIACAVDSGGGPDGTIEAGGPPDAWTHDSSVCPPGEQLCPGCGAPTYCAQVCPAILCLPLDAAVDVFQGGACSPPCSQGQTCCPGGAAGSYSCATLNGGTCPLVP